jgi:uncharacterized repeat protein (TIGR01451 family)
LFRYAAEMLKLNGHTMGRTKVKQAILIGGALATILAGGTLGSLMLSISSTQAQVNAPSSGVPQQKSSLTLLLSVEKQTIQTDAQGKEVKAWQAMPGNNVAAMPGQVLRFTLKAENKGDRPAKKLVLAQPIPPGTSYVLNTAIAESPASIVYSIDGGKTFVAKPTVKVTLPDETIEERPAPAEAYTHVRWLFDRELLPKTSRKVFYQVKLKS